MGRKGYNRRIALLAILLGLMMASSEFLARHKRAAHDPVKSMHRYLRLWSEESLPPDATLASRLRSTEPGVRWDAAQALASEGNRAAVPLLIDAMEDEPGTRRTCAIALSLGELRDPRAVAPLMKATSHPKNADLRVCAVKALGLIGAPEGDDAIIDAYTSGTVGTEALLSLGRLGTEKAVAYLDERMSSEENPVRKTALLKARRLAEATERRGDLEFLTERLEKARGTERQWLIELLSRNSSLDNVSILSSVVADDDEHPDSRGCAAAGLLLSPTADRADISSLLQSGSKQTQRISDAMLAYTSAER